MSQMPLVDQPETYRRPSSSLSACPIPTKIKRREYIPLEMRLVQMDQVASTGQQSFLPSYLPAHLEAGVFTDRDGEYNY